MNSLVSIVVPCYNKEDYIGILLKSIYAQKWDSIELILVNDGSTDRTRDVIIEYIPKLQERGFHVKFIEQQNGGCCKAAYVGLCHATGKYLSLIDADDELDTEYASRMAEFLDQNEEYDICTCDHLTLVKNPAGQIIKRYKFSRWPRNMYSMEFFLCNDLNKAAWAFMIRMDYIKRSKLIENFYTDTRGSYEPSFFISLCAYQGKMKHLEYPLYYYNSYADGMSHAATVEGKIVYWKEYHRCIQVMLQRVDNAVLNKFEKRYYESLSAFYVIKLLLQISEIAKDGKAKQEALRQTFLKFTNTWLSIDPPITYEELCNNTTMVLRAAELALNGLWVKRTGRVIGYGALGKAAQTHLPLLQGTCFEPTELWDAKGDNVRVLQPASLIQNLTANDVVILLVNKKEAIEEIMGQLEGTDATIVKAKHINDLLAQNNYMQLERVAW